MGNCFTVDDTNPETPIHQLEENGGNHRITSTANSSPLNSPDMDPKLISLLDFFKELHGRNQELFSKVIPVHKDEILDVFKKINRDEINNGRSRFHLMLKRSHSTGSVVARGVDLNNGDKMVNERFKVKTLDLGDKTPVAGQGGGGTRPPGAGGT